MHGSGLDGFRCGVNFILNYYDFNSAINNILCITCAHSEASNRSLDARSKVKAIAAVVMLHLCESRYEREVTHDRRSICIS